MGKLRSLWNRRAQREIDVDALLASQSVDEEIADFIRAVATDWHLDDWSLAAGVAESVRLLEADVMAMIEWRNQYQRVYCFDRAGRYIGLAALSQSSRLLAGGKETFEASYKVKDLVGHVFFARLWPSQALRLDGSETLATVTVGVDFVGTYEKKDEERSFLDPDGAVLALVLRKKVGPRTDQATVVSPSGEELARLRHHRSGKMPTRRKYKSASVIQFRRAATAKIRALILAAELLQ